MGYQMGSKHSFQIIRRRRKRLTMRKAFGSRKKYRRFLKGQYPSLSIFEK